MADYKLMTKQLLSLTQDCHHQIANLANAAALLYHGMEGINWAGFYILEGDTLVLGPFQGKTACIEIPVGRGVCGTAVEKKESVLVKDVHAFPGHIACDSASNSEVVIPLWKEGRIWGVLDIDSPLLGRFDERDLEGFTEFASVIEAFL